MPRQLPPLTTGVVRPVRPALDEEIADAVLDRGAALLLPHPAGDEDDRTGLAVIDQVLHHVIALVGAEGQDEEIDGPGHGLDGRHARGSPRSNPAPA